MGRTEKSQGLAPPAVRKDIRAKQARHIINKVIPAVLASNARARKGSENSELIVDPGPNQSPVSKEESTTSNSLPSPKYIKRKGQGRRKAKRGTHDDEDDEIDHNAPSNPKHSKQALTTPPSSIPPPKIRIILTDTLTAAHTLLPKSRSHPNPCILNMASPLRPGGGVLTGATSAEEFLCARTTLLPSLKESFYRLPERGGIFSSDVLVLRNARGLGDAEGELPATQRWYVDVVSAAMLRFPELEGEEGMRRLSAGDRRVVEEKMRGVVRILAGKGVRRVVLGAWGCGAYGNPVRDVGEAWGAVLLGGKREMWRGAEEVVFAITDRRMAEEFAGAFGGGMEVEEGPVGGEDEEEEEADDVAEELRVKIAEMEGQIEKVWNADLKQRMLVILGGLKTQLREREGTPSEGSEDEESVDEGDGGDSEDVGGDEQEATDDSESDDIDGGLRLAAHKAG